MARLSFFGVFGRALGARRLNQQRYANLAEYAERVLQHRYTKEALQGALTRSHVLTKDGLVHVIRIERLLRQLGFHGHFPRQSDKWQLIAEGGSP